MPTEATMIHGSSQIIKSVYTCLIHNWIQVPPPPPRGRIWCNWIPESVKLMQQVCYVESTFWDIYYCRRYTPQLQNMTVHRKCGSLRIPLTPINEYFLVAFIFTKLIVNLKAFVIRSCIISFAHSKFAYLTVSSCNLFRRSLR